MGIFEHMKKNNSRELLFLEEQRLNLKAIIAIDSIILGPANASAKLCNYKSEDLAISDALDIAYYNSMRASLLRKSLGGGSIVLYGDPKKVKSEMYFRALGIFLNRRNGKIYMTKSKGVSYKDLNYVSKESKYILGLEESHNGLGKIYKNRAKGMVLGLKAACKSKMRTNNLKNLKVVVQGVGDLGSELVKELLKENANIIITDKIYDRIKVIQDKVNDIKIVRPDDVYNQKCDIFCSCATEKVIKASDVQKIKCKIITGGTNEIFDKKADLNILKKKKILYIPGYVLNSGDVIQLANELEGFGKEKVQKELMEIYNNTLDFITESNETGKSINEIAIQRAEEYVNKVSAIKMLR